jgi:hypothetical protein
VYPNITAGGVVVGTGLGPSPAATDASGFYHFRPSCYGYLDLAALAPATIALVQAGPESSNKKNPTASLPVASTAGHLLVATANGDQSNTAYTAPAGWVRATAVNQGGSARTEIWYYPDNPGGIISVTFGTPNNAIVQLTEWSGVATVAPLDQTGATAINSNTTTANNSTSGAMTVANELVITNEGYNAGGGATFTPGAGWTTLVNDTARDFASEYRLNLPAGVASETVTSSSATTWSLTIATFKPAGAGGGAVLDPGFYHFNGSGFAGGGGICLNGVELLARDVTLEFVNQAGFSTGTCAPGGGANCTTANCQFGSTPCSISTCPPNAAADSAGGGYTWFAAPCSSAPAGDASCPGSSWCPTGDRACWNLLIWAPATNTGQVAIKGTAAEHWLLGSVFWPGACTDTVNGTSTIAGTLACGTLSVSSAGGVGIAVGSDYGVSTALVEAILVE